jgi:CBS domain-containing protein
MALRAMDVMEKGVRTVGPRMALADLERSLIQHRVSGYPVVDDGTLVGVVSRSDIIRALSVTRSYEGQISDYYLQVAQPDDEKPSEDATGARVGARMDSLTVADAMTRKVLTVEADLPVTEVASLLMERRIHRVPVTENGALVGIITSLDLVQLIAAGRFREA